MKKLKGWRAGLQAPQHQHCFFPCLLQSFLHTLEHNKAMCRQSHSWTDTGAHKLEGASICMQALVQLYLALCPVERVNISSCFYQPALVWDTAERSLHSCPPDPLSHLPHVMAQCNQNPDHQNKPVLSIYWMYPWHVNNDILNPLLSSLLHCSFGPC